MNLFNFVLRSGLDTQFAARTPSVDLSLLGTNGLDLKSSDLTGSRSAGIKSGQHERPSTFPLSPIGAVKGTKNAS